MCNDLCIRGVRNIWCSGWTKIKKIFKKRTTTTKCLKDRKITGSLEQHVVPTLSSLAGGVVAARGLTDGIVPSLASLAAAVVTAKGLTHGTRANVQDT